MSSVHCPKDKEVIPMGSCLTCDYLRKEDDVTTVWCRFLIGNKKEPEKGVLHLYAQINKKEALAERYYKTGKPKVADEITKEIMKLRKEIQDYEDKNKTFDHKEEDIL